MNGEFVLGSVSWPGWQRFLVGGVKDPYFVGRDDHLKLSLRHAADLHLDIPFQGLMRIAPAVAEVLRKSTFDAFNAVTDLCIREQVDALLVARDIFDSADRSLVPQVRFVDGLRRLESESAASHPTDTTTRCTPGTLRWPSPPIAVVLARWSPQLSSVRETQIRNWYTDTATKLEKLGETWSPTSNKSFDRNVLPLDSFTIQHLGTVS